MIEDLLLYENGVKKTPLEYSNKKNQIDLINEILKKFENNRIVALKGQVGSGKSVVGIRTALEMGGGIIATPTKVLGRNYKEDYSNKMYFKHPIEDRKAKISIIEGRGNFKCPEYNTASKYVSATYPDLPCLRPLEDNEKRINLLKRNCSRWSFLFSEKPNGVRGKEYNGLDEKWYWCYNSKQCPYFSQYENYVDSDVLVMNSSKFNVEMDIGRLPDKPLYVIDEADLYLDRLAIKVNITDNLIEKLLDDLEENIHYKKALKRKWESKEDNPKKIPTIIYNIMEDTDIKDKWNKLYWKLKELVDFKTIMNYDINKEKISYIIPTPKTVLKSKLEKSNAKFLLMSATLHDRNVLKNIFGINPPVVKGETKMKGKLRIQSSGIGKINYDKWKKKQFREKYYDNIKRIIDECPKPALVLVHAFKYLPKYEKQKLKKSKDGVYEDGDIIYSTTLKRGANMEGMNSLILLKKPFPSLGNPLYKSMKDKLGNNFWNFYRDKARRELKQQIGRVRRLEEDDVKLYSPDTKLLETVERIDRKN
ncbi:MAG: helicase C-terminal domain-containing protein [archaeon]